jgi:hypothetical protein
VAALKSIRLSMVLFTMWAVYGNHSRAAAHPDTSPLSIRMPDITLRISDSAGVEPSVMTGARSVATDIFRAAGVNPLWVQCVTPGDGCVGDARREFSVRIVSSHLVQDSGWDSSLGFAVPCAGGQEACIVYVLYSRICALAAGRGDRAGRVLGHVMAHEVGHAVLGRNAHGLFGIMRPRLAVNEMERTLYFTPFQARRLRTQVMAWSGGRNR